MIGTRLSSISCNKSEFDRCKPTYEEALKSSGYTEGLHYEPPEPPKRNRPRNILWFNPPFSKNVKTNIGGTFLSLVEAHFPTTHKFHKIFNKNTVKISYSCMDNMKSIIQNHNKSILEGTRSPDLPCNCRKGSACPLDSHCMAKGMVYKATIETALCAKEYYGACETTFKARFANHKYSVTNPSKQSSTLSEYQRKCNEEKIPYTLKWEIHKRAKAYKNGARSCNLCDTEKYTILMANRDRALNRRDELVTKCRHENKFYLKDVD